MDGPRSDVESAIWVRARKLEETIGARRPRLLMRGGPSFLLGCLYRGEADQTIHASVENPASRSRLPSSIPRASTRGSRLAVRLVFSVSLASCLLVGCWVAPAWGQQEGTNQGYAEQLQNPVTDLMNIPLMNLVDSGVGEANAYDLLLTIQPQLPLPVSKSWKVIVWTVFNLRSRPPSQRGEDRANGIEDTVARFLLAPAGRKPLRWGIGPAVLVPTATRASLGAGTVALGGAGAVSYQVSPWTAGVLVQHLTSVEEASGGRDTERGLFRPSLGWTASSGVNIGLNSQTTVEWNAPKGSRWTVPLEATVGQVANIGRQTLNLQVGARRYLDAPPGGPDWGLQLTATFILPVRPHVREQDAASEVPSDERE